MKRPRSIPRLGYGTLDGVHVRLWGDIDDSGVHLAGMPHIRLWRVHEVLFDGSIELFKRGFHNDITLEQAAAELGVTLYGD